mmetsp:Transcript_75941/g.176136  ORF Transcript_75941/g.176136 Transcript_75941/m.176136 type:complete len:629 (+) Transcript_75941:125-2011(+)
MGTWEGGCEDDEEEFQGRPDQGYTPETCRRWPTDTGCLVIFVFSMLLLVYFLVFAGIRGHPFEQEALKDYQGQVCGITEAVALRPYLFFCRDVKQEDRLNLDSPICVRKCPESQFTSHFCTTDGQNMSQVSDYPTTHSVGSVCMPVSESHNKVVARVVRGRQGARFLVLLRNILDRMWPIVISGFVAVALGSCQVFLLRRFGLGVVWLGLGCMAGIPFLYGIDVMVNASYEGKNGALFTSSKSPSLVMGLVICLASLAFAGFVHSERRNLLLCRPCLRAAVECIVDTVDLIVEPFVSCTIRCTLFVVLLGGFLLLLCVGEWTEEEVVLPWPLSLFAVFFMLASLWVMEVCVALSQFVIAYVAEEWFFASLYGTEDRVPWMPARAYKTALRYHLGSLALGALVVPLAKLPRAVLHSVSEASESERCGWLEGSCGCCIRAYRELLRGLGRTAYMELALDSLSFQKAAKQSVAVMSREDDDASRYTSANYLIELGLTGGIAAFCMLVTHGICLWIPPFNDPHSEYFVPDPWTLDVIAGLICFAVALHFMLVIAHVSENLLYCCAVERVRHPLGTLAVEVEEGMLRKLIPCSSSRAERYDPSRDRRFAARHEHNRALFEAVARRSVGGTTTD